MIKRSFRFGIVKNYGFAITGGFAQLHITLNNGCKNEIAERTFHLFIYLVSQAKTRIVHRQQESLNFQSRIQLRLNNLYRIQQFTDTFQRKILALNGDDD